MSRFFKSALFPIIIVVALAFFASRLITPSSNSGPPHTYARLPNTEIPSGLVKSVDVKTKGNELDVTLKDGSSYSIGYVDQATPQLFSELAKYNVAYNVEPDKSNMWLGLLAYVLPFLRVLGFWLFLMNQVQGGGSKVMSFGKSRAKRLSADSPKITFRDVAGVDEAVEELDEIKEFLENPK